MPENTKVNAGSESLVKKNVSLQAYNTLSIPASAAYFARCTSLEQLVESLNFARENELQVLVLGEGSNTVFSKDFDGLLVLNRLTGVTLLNDNSDNVLVEVAAGESWHDFVRYSLNQSWYGLENLALIPGLVGAAPIQNIGAYGVEVKEAIVSVNTYDIESQEVIQLSNLECQFAYRDSIFKQALADKRLITSVVFRLSKWPKVRLSYPALADHLNDSPSPLDVFNAVCEIRSSKLPMPEDMPNAGSFFKNPIVDQSQYARLKASFPKIVAFTLDNDKVKLAAAWMIDQRGWKNKSVDAVYVHREHALVVVNPNSKPGVSVLKLAAAIQQDIESTFGVSLDIEPRVY